MTEGAAELRARLENVLRTAAVEVRPCKACGTLLAFVPRPAPPGEKASIIPYTLDGVNHFLNCPKAAEFTHRRPIPRPDARQPSMFDTTPRPK